jgi:hypothetical protein
VSFKVSLCTFAVAVVLLFAPAQALKLTDGLYFTVLPNSTAEVYFILPDDVGAGMGKADYFITTASNWSTDLTQETQSTEENNTIIIPIRFFSSDKREGDCSNYTVSVSSPQLGISRSWRGGVCLSKYSDVDIVRKAAATPQAVLDTLNENADLFSVGFRAYEKTVTPGSFSVELLLQSQAGLSIDITADSPLLEKTSFFVQTGRAAELKTVLLEGNAASPGIYDIKVTAKARNCSLGSCTKQASMRLVVSDSAPKGGYSVSIFPENLDIKNLVPIPYSFTVQNNYGQEVSFLARLEKPLDLDSSFIVETLAIPALSETAVNFTVTPRNQTGLYEIKVIVSANDLEKEDSAYLSVNEMVSDVYRNADNVKSGANSSVKASVDSKVRSWYSSYSKSEYGSNTTAYSSVQDAIQSAKSVPEEEVTEENQTEDADDQESQSNPLGIIVIPVVIGAGVLAALLFLRKRKGKDSLDRMKF